MEQLREVAPDVQRVHREVHGDMSIRLDLGHMCRASWNCKRHRRISFHSCIIWLQPSSYPVILLYGLSGLSGYPAIQLSQRSLSYPAICAIWASQLLGSHGEIRAWSPNKTSILDYDFSWSLFSGVSGVCPFKPLECLPQTNI